MSMTFFWLLGAGLLILLIIFFMFRMRMLFAFFAAFLLIVLLRSGVFVVYEGSQVVITQFGEVIGKPYTKAGLYFKVPIIWKTNYIEKRILAEEERQPGVATKDGYFINLNVAFFWKISDGAEYLNTVDSLEDAKLLLRNLVSGSVRQVVSAHDLISTIRSISPESLSDNASTKSLLGHSAPSLMSSEMLDQNFKIKVGREMLMQDAKEQVNNYLKKYGMEILYVFITSVQYSPEVEIMINRRMVLERLREAARLRSKGRSESNRIRGLMVEDYQKIIAPAEKEALLIRGKAEAYVTRVTAEAFSQDREFYNYWSVLQTYQYDLAKNSRGILMSTDLPLLKFMTDPLQFIARPNASYKGKTDKQQK